ncbi:endonuclease/exonuclease/phosphatase family protein [Patulibacter sp. SYSU D01012]|uniref:endonuclease/exonuclease/phosphatase family protein n=1 Tax=Patulibacter sp. SYSU D01012 TaxID=2817381 RepID=UPI001B30CCFF|nr:endonuclease/exonuclease/phosphatase family protein [Patulibacter sp. SYSU D01012]
MAPARVLTWNLFHGRAVPPAGRPLLHEFAATLAAWPWDVALLQEVPPWWPPLLARAAGADAVSARTSRNAVLPVRRAIARRAPDVARSNGGGANAILVRGGLRVVAHGRRRLRTWPERRVVHAVRLHDPAGGPLDGAWAGDVHAQKGAWDDGPGLRRPLADLALSAERLAAWAAADGATRPRPPADPGGAARPTTGPEGPPLLLGGDLNLPRSAVEVGLPPGWRRIASSGPDHVVGRGLAAAADSQRPPRGALSDHAALVVAVRRADG